MRPYIAPIIAAVAVIAAVIGAGIFYYWVFTMANFSIAVRTIFVILPLSVVGILIAVLVQRINELRKGEEDDLSQY